MSNKRAVRGRLYIPRHLLLGTCVDRSDSALHERLDALLWLLAVLGHCLYLECLSADTRLADAF